MSRRSFAEPEIFRRLLGQIIEAAAAREITERELAKRAGAAPETLSRMKARGDGDFGLVARLAQVAGLRLTLVTDSATLESLRRGDFF